MNIRSDEIMLEQLVKDIREAYLQFLGEINDETTRTTLKVAVEEVINNAKTNNYFSFFDVDVNITADNRDVTIHLIPKNKETFLFLAKNYPDQFRDIGWDDELNTMFYYC